jgi:hypothetical protein
MPTLFILKSRQFGSHSSKEQQKILKYLRPKTLRPILLDSLPFSTFLEVLL